MSLLGNEIERYKRSICCELFAQLQNTDIDVPTQSKKVRTSKVFTIIASKEEPNEIHLLNKTTQLSSTVPTLNSEMTSNYL